MAAPCAGTQDRFSELNRGIFCHCAALFARQHVADADKAAALKAVRLARSAQH